MLNYTSSFFFLNRKLPNDTTHPTPLSSNQIVVTKWIICLSPTYVISPLYIYLFEFTIHIYIIIAILSFSWSLSSCLLSGPGCNIKAVLNSYDIGVHTLLGRWGLSISFSLISDTQDRAAYHTQGIWRFRETEIIPAWKISLDSPELNILNLILRFKSINSDFWQGSHPSFHNHHVRKCLPHFISDFEL